MSIDVGKIPWNRRKLPLHSEQFVVNYLKMVRFCAVEKQVLPERSKSKYKFCYSSNFSPSDTV